MSVIIDKAWREAIDAKLKERGIGRSAYGRMLGVSPQVVTNYLNGHDTPSVELMEQWAGVAGLDLTVLFPTAAPTRVRKQPA